MTAHRIPRHLTVGRPPLAPSPPPLIGDICFLIAVEDPTSGRLVGWLGWLPCLAFPSLGFLDQNPNGDNNAGNRRPAMIPHRDAALARLLIPERTSSQPVCRCPPASPPYSTSYEGAGGAHAPKWHHDPTTSLVLLLAFCYPLHLSIIPSLLTRTVSGRLPKFPPVFNAWMWPHLEGKAVSESLSQTRPLPFFSGFTKLQPAAAADRHFVSVSRFPRAQTAGFSTMIWP